MKRCSRCTLNLSLDSFGVKPSNKDGMRKVCNSCAHKMTKDKLNEPLSPIAISFSKLALLANPEIKLTQNVYSL